MQKTTYYCDGCGAEKKEVNHWWIVTVNSGDRSEFCIRPWQIGLAALSPKFPILYKMYCGQACVVKALSEYMEHCREKVET